MEDKMKGKQSNMVQILAPGVFFGQIVKILQVKRKKGHTDYQLDVKWGETPRPSWFGADEFRFVRNTSHTS
jgi:hypothetical protein